LQADSLPAEPPGKPVNNYTINEKKIIEHELEKQDIWNYFFKGNLTSLESCSSESKQREKSQRIDHVALTERKERYKVRALSFPQIVPFNVEIRISMNATITRDL